MRRTLQKDNLINMNMRMNYKPMTIGRAIFAIFFSLVSSSYAQTNEDYFGNGNTVGITVSGSDTDTQGTLSGLTGGPGENTEANAVRFLQQSTLGYDYEDVQNLYNIGYDRWIENQMTMPQNGLYAEYLEFRDFAESIGAPLPNDTNGYVGYTFYNKVINDDDQLRLRIGFALSQILVISTEGIGRESNTITDYFDIFYKQAFGNFRDILYDVTLHRAMGIYLSYINNKKEDMEAGTFPDENFAREVMQLFTIGLYELNNDGTRKVDTNGEFIPTYDNEDIVQMAKVFTGLVKDNDSFSMKVEESNHDVGPKTMIDGSVLPANRSTLQDVGDAIDVLFNHANMGPFLLYPFNQAIGEVQPQSCLCQ